LDEHRQRNQDVGKSVPGTVFELTWKENPDSPGKWPLFVPPVFEPPRHQEDHLEPE
jgi:hypothetical protein